MSRKIYIKRTDEGYALVRYSSLAKGKGLARGTLIQRLAPPFPTYGEALAALQEMERQEHLESIMGGSFYG